ncbi:hypothetical protein ACEXOS_015200 [Herbiconiux sp. P16]|uniref:hypothetical protein n=1 Tax=Herbiconiux wuyangfengii TaxID=3342794 RepID=UPI0035B806C9
MGTRNLRQRHRGRHFRGEYREHLEDQVPDADATRLVIESFDHLRKSDSGELWIALAAAQTQVGRLDTEVKAAALAAMDRGAGLELWADAGPTELAKRVAALQKLRDQLTGPQSAPKKLREPWRYEETELAAGDVLSYTGSNGQMALFRVAGINRSRLGDSPYVEWLDWTGRKAPGPWRLARLKPTHAPATRTITERPVIYTVTRFRKQDVDWKESGFVHVARLPSWRSDNTLQSNFSAGWRGLGRLTERHLNQS